MIGFRVTMSDGSSRSIEADHYAVDDTGELVVTGGGSRVFECPAGDWVMIDAAGVRLAREWPPDNLEYAVASVAQVLGVRFGHYVHQLAEVSRFTDWRMNDLDSLSRELLSAVGIDDAGSSQRAEISEVRDLVASHFGVSAQ